MKNLYLLAFVLISSTYASIAQQVIEGSVKDDKTNETLVGATIQIKGTKKGVSANTDGKFSIEVKNEFPYTLLVHFVGYKSTEFLLKEIPKSRLEVKLSALQDLEEVVVVGYGTQKRGDFTGALASIPEVLKSQPVSSPERLLQGSVSGIQVTQSSGQPGAGVSIRVRGGTSINAGSEPLYVIDGFPIYNGEDGSDAGVTSGSKINPLANISSADIESIDVLKDASATAIYGSRGANGVILISTKKGNFNKSEIHYDAYYGNQDIIKTIPLLNAEQWGSLKNDARASANKAPLYTPDELKALGKGTDWQGEAFTSAAIQSHNLSITKGTDSTRIMVSLNYFDQDGVIRNTGFNRYSGRLNADYNVSSRLKIGAFLTGSYTTADVAPKGLVQALLEMPPTVPLRDESGAFTKVSSFETTIGNPISTLFNQINETKTSRFLLNGFGEYRIIEGLTAKVMLGTDLINNKQNRYLPSTLLEGTPGGSASIGSLSTTNWLNENTLNYKRTFNNHHTIDILVGNTQQQAITEILTASSSNFVNDGATFNDLTSGSVIGTPSSYYNKWTLISYLARLNYGLNDKYFLTLTVRSDGASRFGEGNKWGTFPSAAIAWNAGRESFLESNTISQLKFRLSAGLTGNQEIPTYRSLGRLAYYRYNFNDVTVGGFAPSSYANPDLGWEKTTQYNFGIDFGIFGNRINLSSDIYYKRTNDLLLEVPLPYTAGIESAFQNYGSIENKGIELNLQTQNLTGAFKWNTNLVFSSNKNKVLSLGPGVTEFVPINPSNPQRTSEIVRVGQPLGNFNMYVTDGIFQQGDNFSLSPTPNAGPGMQRYKDLDGDGKITQSGDMAIIGNSRPKFLAGLTNTFSYKNFDLTIFLQSSYGNKIFNNSKALLEIGSGFTGASTILLNRWTPSNTNTDIHKAVEDPAPTLSDRFVEDGSYLRLKNLTIGYNLPKSFSSKLKIQNARIYFTAQNLITWTKYSGFDPEVSLNGQNALSSGFDFGSYPGTKAILASLSITF